jgi:hypothetical protein
MRLDVLETQHRMSLDFCYRPCNLLDNCRTAISCELMVGPTIANMSNAATAQSQREEAQDHNKIALPGIGLPLGQRDELPHDAGGSSWSKLAHPVTVRELIIIAVLAALKDKPDWEHKIFDGRIVDEWRLEVLKASNAMQAQD